MERDFGAQRERERLIVSVSLFFNQVTVKLIIQKLTKLNHANTNKQNQENISKENNS